MVSDSMPFEHLIRNPGDLKGFASEYPEGNLDKVLRDMNTSIVKKFADAKEQYLLKVFGSYENAQKVAHLYVFEEDDLDIQPSEDEGKYLVRYNFRVRPKTAEELAADEARKAEKATQPRDEDDIHEWTEVAFNYAGWIECVCGYRPQSQEDMDEHIPPGSLPVAPTY